MNIHPTCSTWVLQAGCYSNMVSPTVCAHLLKHLLQHVGFHVNTLMCWVVSCSVADCWQILTWRAKYPTRGYVIERLIAEREHFNTANHQQQQQQQQQQQHSHPFYIAMEEHPTDDDLQERLGFKGVCSIYYSWSCQANSPCGVHPSVNINM
jgi:hypothetical protein